MLHFEVLKSIPETRIQNHLYKINIKLYEPLFTVDQVVW